MPTAQPSTHFIWHSRLKGCGQAAANLVLDDFGTSVWRFGTCRSRPSVRCREWRAAEFFSGRFACTYNCNGKHTLPVLSDPVVGFLFGRTVGRCH